MVQKYARRCVKPNKSSGLSYLLNQAMIVGTKSGLSTKWVNSLGVRIKTARIIKLPGSKPGIKIIKNLLNSQLDLLIIC